MIKIDFLSFVLYGGIAFLVLSIIILVLLIAFTTGFKNTGRLVGGINIYFAPPGEGKSFIGTALILELMRKGRRVFSNWPVRSVDGKYCSKVWWRALMKENLSKGAIFLDEAQKDFWSRNFEKFSEDDLAWFTQCGQYEISLNIFTQNLDNIDVIIRRVANTFIEVRKTEIPLLELPLFFTLSEFTSMEDYISYQRGIVSPWHTERIWFSKDIASAYDTKWFAQDERPIYQGISWVKFLTSQGRPPTLPTEFSLFRHMKIRFNGIFSALLQPFKKVINTCLIKLNNYGKTQQAISGIGNSIRQTVTGIRILCKRRKGDKKGGV